MLLPLYKFFLKTLVNNLVVLFLGASVCSSRLIYLTCAPGTGTDCFLFEDCCRTVQLWNGAFSATIMEHEPSSPVEGVFLSLLLGVDVFSEGLSFFSVQP